MILLLGPVLKKPTIYDLFKQFIKIRVSTQCKNFSGIFPNSISRDCIFGGYQRHFKFTKVDVHYIETLVLQLKLINVSRKAKKMLRDYITSLHTTEIQFGVCNHQLDQDCGCMA